MRLLLAGTVFLIVYGSLYPFGVDLRHYQPALLDALLDFSVMKSSRGDLVENVLLFVPFGLFAIRVFPRRSFVLRLMEVLLVAFLLAYSLQAAQLVIPGRQPAGSDAVWNVFGCAVGCFLGLLRLDSRLQRMLGFGAAPDIPALLALAWLIHGFAPFVPSLDLQLMKEHVRILLAWSLNPVWATQTFIMWLIVFRFLSRSASPALSQQFYPVIVAVTLASGFMMIGQAVSPDKIVGGVLALVVWFALGKRIGPLLLACALAMVIVGINFIPFELRDRVASFSWIPFSGSLTGNPFVNVLAVLKKLVLYGSLIWLLTEIGFRLRAATVTVAVFLFVNEYLQVFFVNTKPEITDALFALALGAAFHRYDCWRRASPCTGEGYSSVAAEAGARTDPTGIRNTAVADRSPTHTDHVPGMDGLRAVAALAVFLVHFNQQARLQAEIGPFDLARWMANGNTGVALFFVLSGFLLALPFWREQYAGAARLDVRQYFVRRIARILPAYYLCLFGLLAIKFAAGAFPSINNVLSHVLFLHNLNDHNILSLNEPFWTLAVEVQFYLLLPLLMWGFRRWDRRMAFLLVSSLAVAAYLLNYALVSYLLARNQWPIQFTLLWPFSVYVSGPDSFVLRYSTPGHLTYFVVGIATALVYVAGPAQLRRASPAACDLVFWGCALSLFFVLSTSLDDALKAPHGHYNWPVVPLLLAIMIFVTPRAALANAILESRALRGIGIVSYGVYVFHYPIQKLVGRGFRLLGYSVGEHWWAFGAVSLAASIGVAAVSYLLLERPIIHWARHRRAGTVAQREKGSPAGPRRDRARLRDRGPVPVSVESDWINVLVRLEATQVRTLQQIADREGSSLSGAARGLLARFLSVQEEPAKSSDGLGAVRRLGAIPEHGRAAEDCHINLRRWQYDGLSSIAQRSGMSIDELVAAVIETHRTRQ